MNLENVKKSLPFDLRRAVSGYVWRQNNVGLSAAQIFRLDAAGKNSLYLKINRRVSKPSLSKEKINLEWLKNRLPVPEVLLFAEDETSEFLLLSAIPGADASAASLKENAPRTIKELTGGLRTIHELPIENCPFDARLDYKIEAARQRMLNGAVDETDFDQERLGRTAEDLFEELLANAPTSEDLVFTHGDYCLPNVILDSGKLSGFVDWGSAGVADKYQDIALLTRSVRDNFGADWEKKAFELYGAEPDWKKIRFYRLLDEFF